MGAVTTSPGKAAHGALPIRGIGGFALVLSGVSTIIGSGWLMAANEAARIAGPAALLSWVIGAGAVLLIGLTIAEIGTVFPQSGGMTRYMQYTHGTVAGFVAAWINWLGIVATIPTEAAASVQYMASRPDFAFLFDPATGHMTGWGLVVASGLVVFYFVLNLWTLSLFVKSMSAITVFKMVVPLLTAGLLAAAAFHSQNFGGTAATFAPNGWPAVLTAVSAGGIIFAFNGFQTVVNLAGEAKNPTRTIPIAIIGSVVACLFIYLALQVAFIGAVDPAAVAQGWSNLHFSSPFAQLALSFNLNLLALLLYVDAFVSPSGTGITYAATTGRMLFGMQRNGYVPGFVGVLDPRYGTPRNAMLVNLLLAFAFLWIFQGWGPIVEVVGVMNALSFIAGPIAVAGLARIAPDLPRPVRIPGMKLIGPLSFVVVSLIVYWSRWPLTGEVVLVVLVGLALLFAYKMRTGWDTMREDLRGGMWLIGYLVAMALLSLLGGSEFGGWNVIPGRYGLDEMAVVAVALAFYAWGARSAWATPALARMRQADPADQL